MADIVDLHVRLQARQAEEQRLDLTAEMIPIMAATIETFVVMGASPEHISASDHRGAEGLRAKGKSILSSAGTIKAHRGL